MHFHSYSFHDLTIFQKPSNVMVFITCRYLNFCYASYLNFCFVLPVVIFKVLLYFYLLEVSVSCIFLPIVLFSVLLSVYLLYLSVPFCTQLYFCLLYISVLVPVSVFLDFNCHTFEWSAVSLPVYRSGGFIHLVRIVTPFGFPTFVSPVLIVWVFYCTVFFISSILN